MADNPIKYSELIQDDGSIQNLIEQLNQAITAFDTAKGKIQSTCTELVKSLQSISGATEEQRQEIEKVVKTQEQLLAEYEKVDSETRTAYREKQKLTQAQKEAQSIDKLTIQLNNAKKGSYNALSAEYRLCMIQLNAMGAAERNTAEGKALINHAKNLREEMSRLKKETGDYRLEVGHYQNAMLALPGPLGQVTRAFGNMGKNMASVFRSEMPAGQKALAGLKVGIVGLIAVVVALGKSIADLVKTNAQFEQANANLQSVLGASKDEMEALTQTALSLGRSTEWTASQVTSLQMELAKLGFGEASIVAMQKHVLAFATAVGADLAEAANMAGAAIRAFNLTSADSERVMGTLAVAVNESALSFDRIKYAMGTVFPIANAFGLEIEDATAMLGALANAGFSAESAATATRNMLLNLADANGKLAKRTGGAARSFDDIMDKMVQLRKEGADLSEIFELTDKRSVAAFNALMSGTETAKELRRQLSDVQGELKRIQQTRLDTVTGQTTILKSYWEGLKLSFRESNGVIKQMIVYLQQAVQWSNKLLFPEQAAKSEALDKYLEQFGNLYKELQKFEDVDIQGLLKEKFDLAVQGMERSLTTINAEIEKVQKAPIQQLPGMGTTSAQARLMELNQQKQAIEGQLEGIRQAYKITNEQILNDQMELATQQELQRQADADKAKALSDDEKKQRIKDLQARIDQIKMEISYTEKGTQEMLNKRLELVEAERDLEIEKNNQAEETAKKDSEVINKKFNNDRIQTERDFYKEVATLRLNALQADKAAIDARLSLAEEGSEEMLNLQIASLEKERDIAIQQNRQKDEKVRQNEETIAKTYWKRIFKLEADFLTKRAKQNLEAYQELEASEFALLDRNERQKTEFRLQQEKERLIKILEINSTASKQMTAQEVQTIQNTIKAIEKEMSRLPYDNIYELMGIGLDDKQQDALNTAFSSIKDSIDSIIDSWNKAADAAVNAADKQVEAAQKALEAEIEARDKGYANNVETAQKELDLAKKNQQKALKEKEKAQKAQLKIDTITQASSLITATANIWSALGGIPMVGPALAIAAIAAMWGSFAVAKVKASQVTKQSEEYGEGTIELLEGGSHASGHDIDMGYDAKKRKRRRAEGGEYFAIINKRNSAKYRNIIPEVIKSFNDGTFAEKYQKANTIMDGIAINMVGSGTDVSVLEKNVKAIRQQGEKQVYTDGENIVIRYKNLTQRIKK